MAETSWRIFSFDWKEQKKLVGTWEIFYLEYKRKRSEFF
jgi:hypothetical protein